jgi:hypothetical protein
MTRICLPLSDLLEKNTRLGQELLALADVLEFRQPRTAPHIPDKPQVFHWGYGLVQTEFSTTFQKAGLGEFLAQSGCRLFSFDLGPACRKSKYIMPTSRVLRAAEILDISARTLDDVRRAYDGALAAENYNYYPTGMYEHVCRPDFIGRFLERMDLGLVLDIAHAVVSADNLKLDRMAYIRELPLDRVVEIHVSRPRRFGPIMADFHAAPQKEDFDFLASVLHMLPSTDEVLVAIEYYRDLKKLVQTYRTLETRLKDIHP